jgi:hypothetical protein
MISDINFRNNKMIECNHVENERWLSWLHRTFATFYKKGTTTTVKQAFCNMEQMHNNELVT